MSDRPVVNNVNREDKPSYLMGAIFVLIWIGAAVVAVSFLHVAFKVDRLIQQCAPVPGQMERK